MKRWLLTLVVMALGAAPTYAQEAVNAADAPVVAQPAAEPSAQETPAHDSAAQDGAVTPPDHDHDASAATVEDDHTIKAALMAHNALKVGTATTLNLRLSYANGKRVKPRDLKVVHTRPIHLLVVDQTLTDYQHIHPKVGKAGKWHFSFTPKKAGPYRIFVDVTPKKGEHQYIKLDLEQPAQADGTVDKAPTSVADMGGYYFTLSFDDTVKAGQAVMGHVKVTDKYGKPTTDLQPVMGAYAHIVGFSEDRESVVHIHPLGKEPTKRSDRGGPDLDFHFEPEKAGFVKLFVQTKIGGKDVFAPFGVEVAQ